MTPTLVATDASGATVTLRFASEWTRARRP